MKPILKWAGGKSWATKAFGDVLYDLDFKNYIEPFLGGASMALHLADHPTSQNMILGDIEAKLMHTYVTIRDMPKEVAEAMEDFTEFGTDENAYYLIRDTEPDDFVDRAARFVYLNKLCFNGLYRVNKSGLFNVPYGKNPKRSLPGEKQFQELAEAFAGAEFHVCDFTKLVAAAGPGDLIYADPPYHQAFVDYTKGGFDEGDQERLAEALYYAADKGAQIVLHNSDTEKVRYWYSEWLDILQTSEKRNINVVGSKRGGTPCVVATNIPELIEFFHTDSTACG